MILRESGLILKPENLALQKQKTRGHRCPEQTGRSNPVANARAAHPKARPLQDPASPFYCDLFHEDARSCHAARSAYVFLAFPGPEILIPSGLMPLEIRDDGLRRGG